MILCLGPVQYIDLNGGLARKADVREFSDEDERALLDAMAANRNRSFPIPATSLHAPCGYQMRVLVMASGEIRSSRDIGGALIAITSAEDDAVLTFGVGRFDDEVATMWTLSYNQPLLPLRPLDCPRVPWIARRIDGNLPAHDAMLPELTQVGRAAAMAWLKFKAFQDSQQGADGE